MSDAPLIEYAPAGHDMPGDRLLRRIVAWSAIGYGTVALINTSLHVGLAKGWVASPANMSWELGTTQYVVTLAAQSLAMGVLMVGGGLLLRRSRASIPILRAAVASSFGLAVAGLASNLSSNPAYAVYWSTPALGVSYVLQYLGHFWLPALIVLLTLPPLARRMV